MHPVNRLVVAALQNAHRPLARRSRIRRHRGRRVPAAGMSARRVVPSSRRRARHQRSSRGGIIRARGHPRSVTNHRPFIGVKSYQVIEKRRHLHAGEMTRRAEIWSSRLSPSSENASRASSLGVVARLVICAIFAGHGKAAKSKSCRQLTTRQREISMIARGGACRARSERRKSKSLISRKRGEAAPSSTRFLVII